MAFIKSKTLPSGVSGDYWRIIQRNSNFQRDDDIITIQLYVSNQARIADLQPLNDSVQFNFSPSDYPLSDFNPDRVNTADVEDFRDLELHVRYLHIKDVAMAAQAKVDAFMPTDKQPEVELSSNEQAALFFLDAKDS